MGVTIHFEGKLRDEAAFDKLLCKAKTLAAQREWQWEKCEIEEAGVIRAIGEELVEYNGPLKGIVIDAHEKSEPIQLLFDGEFFIQSFVKTQFAGADTHIAVVEFLRELEGDFETFSVQDEGAYWDTRDRELLCRKMGFFTRILEDMEAGLEAALGEVPPEERTPDRIELEVTAWSKRRQARHTGEGERKANGNDAE